MKIYVTRAADIILYSFHWEGNSKFLPISPFIFIHKVINLWSVILILAAKCWLLALFASLRPSTGSSCLIQHTYLERERFFSVRIMEWHWNSYTNNNNPSSSCICALSGLWQKSRLSTFSDASIMQSEEKGASVCHQKYCKTARRKKMWNNQCKYTKSTAPT